MIQYNHNQHCLELHTGRKFVRELNGNWEVNKENLINSIETFMNRVVPNRQIEMTGYDIVERDCPPVVLEGVLTEFGEYDDYTIMINDQDIERILAKNYIGVKCKITIEPLE